MSHPCDHFPPASKCRVPATSYTQKSGQQVLSFIRNHLLVIVVISTSISRPSDYIYLQRRIPLITVSSISRPSDYLHLHPNVASQRPPAPNDRRLLHPKTTSHRLSVLQLQHPHISCCIPVTTHSQRPTPGPSCPFPHISPCSPWHLSDSHSQRVDDSSSRLFVILATLSICAPTLHSGDYHSHMPCHIPVTTCTQRAADRLSRPFNITFFYLTSFSPLNNGIQRVPDVRHLRPSHITIQQPSMPAPHIPYRQSSPNRPQQPSYHVHPI